MTAFFGIGSHREADDLAAQEADARQRAEEIKQRAAEILAEEFGTDVSEWLV